MKLAQSRGVLEVPNDDFLTESGVLNSIGIFRVAQSLEDEFSIRVAADEMLPENFTTIDQMSGYATRKMSGRGPA